VNGHTSRIGLVTLLISLTALEIGQLTQAPAWLIAVLALIAIIGTLLYILSGPRDVS
jgi:hypothetical protein